MKRSLRYIEGVFNKIDGMEDVAISLYDLWIEIELFENLCINKHDDKKDIMRLFEAKSHFETCLTIVKNLIEPDKNNMIEKVNNDHQSHDVIENKVQNLLTILDNDVNKIIQKSEDYGKLVSSLSVQILIKSFREKLMNMMETLIILPLISSTTKYRMLENRLEAGVNKREVFEYILFKEVFLSSKIKGSEERRKSSASSGVGNVSFSETNVTKNPRSRTFPSYQLLDTTPPDVEEGFKDIFSDEDLEGTNDEIVKESI